MNYLLSQSTRDRLMRLLQSQGLSGSARWKSSGLWCFLRCDSATAVGGSDVLNECYPATLVDPFTNQPLANADTYGGFLLTVIGDNAAAAAPHAGGVYECLLTTEVVGDASGTTAGRPRAFGVPLGVTGAGTDNHVTRWDGTGTAAIQDSLATLDDSGNFTTAGDIRSTNGNANIYCGPGSLVSGAIARLYCQTGIAYISLATGVHTATINLTDTDGFYVNLNPLTFTPFILGTPGGTNAGFCFAVTDTAGTTHNGVSGTIAPGATVLGGIVTALGSGSFLTDPGDGLAGGTYS